MKNTISALTLLVGALVLTACTNDLTTGSPSPVVTETVTASGEASVPGDPHKCESARLEAEVTPGEGPSPDVWLTAIVVTNLGPDACSLDGMSEVEFFTGGDGRPLGVEQIASDEEAPADLVILEVQEQATMSMTFPTAPADNAPSDCLVGAGRVEFTLQGDGDDDGDRAEAEAWLPPVCGAVSVTSWFFGGAPGVAPN
jgi:hypothetical protein